LLFNYVKKKGINDWNEAAAAVPGKNAKQVSDNCVWSSKSLADESSAETSGCQWSFFQEAEMS
jgi:hypothetical protein